MNQNKSRAKPFVFILLLGLGGLALIAALSTMDESQNNQETFVPLFRLLGKTPQSMSRVVQKVLPIDSVDEAELGKQIAASYGKGTGASPAEQKTLDYLNALMDSLETKKQKPFSYEVRMIGSASPNAFALPGGVIVVTSGLLTALKSESELVSVLAHEMGHVELSHCFDAVKFEILTKKLTHTSLGAIADFAQRLLISHSYSKNQEDEADLYGYKMLVVGPYDPMAMAHAFLRLQAFGGGDTSDTGHALREYLMSHSPLEQRIAKFQTEAQLFWRKSASGGRSTSNHLKRYVGLKNLTAEIPLSKQDFGGSEWVTETEALTQ